MATTFESTANADRKLRRRYLVGSTDTAQDAGLSGEGTGQQQGQGWQRGPTQGERAPQQRTTAAGPRQPQNAVRQEGPVRQAAPAGAPPPPPPPPPPGAASQPGAQKTGEPPSQVAAPQTTWTEADPQTFALMSDPDAADMLLRELERINAFGGEGPDFGYLDRAQEALDEHYRIAKEDALRQLDEYMASRGITGSSTERWDQVQLSRRLAADKGAQMVELERERARLEAEESRFRRSLAENVASRIQQSLQFDRQLSQQESQFVRGLAEQVASRLQQDEQFKARMAMESEHFERQIAEQIASRLQQDEQFRAQLNQQDAHFQAQLAEQIATRLQQDEHFRMELQIRELALEIQRYGIDQQTAVAMARIAADQAMQQQMIAYYRDRDAQEHARWQEQMAYQRERDQIGDERWERQFEHQTSMDERRLGLEEDRLGLDRDRFDYQKERDQIGDERYREQFDYQKERDQIGDERWERQWGRQEQQDALNTLDYMIRSGIPITDEVAAQFADILGVSPDDVKKAAGPSGPPGFEDYQIRTNPDKGNRVEHWHDGEWRVMEQDPATGQWFYQKKVAPGHWTKVYI